MVTKINKKLRMYDHKLKEFVAVIKYSCQKYQPTLASLMLCKSKSNCTR